MFFQAVRIGGLLLQTLKLFLLHDELGLQLGHGLSELRHVDMGLVGKLLKSTGRLLTELLVVKA